MERLPFPTCMSVRWATLWLDVAPDLQVTKMQLLDAILNEMSHEGFTETDADDFWDDMMDLRKAKNIR